MENSKWVSRSLVGAIRAVAVSAAVVVGAYASAPAAQAATVTFGDSTFADADWELIQNSFGPGGTATAAQVPTGGNPDAYRSHTITLNQPVGAEASAFPFSGSLPSTYDPSLGAITSVDFSIDTIGLLVGNQRVGVAAKQDSVIYIVTTPGVFATEFEWTNKIQSGLTADDFGTITDPSIHPDFTESGGVIEFGFYSATSAPAGSTAGTNTIGLDNWSVTLTTGEIEPPPPPPPPGGVIPLPAPLLLGASGLLAAAAAKRRGK